MTQHVMMLKLICKADMTQHVVIPGLVGMVRHDYMTARSASVHQQAMSQPGSNSDVPRLVAASGGPWVDLYVRHD
jgi:hypothetical protein